MTEALVSLFWRPLVQKQSTSKPRALYTVGKSLYFVTLDDCRHLTLGHFTAISVPMSTLPPLSLSV